MEYRHVNGPVYCCYAFTPPTINSEFARRFGIQAPSTVELQVGSNVKLRMLLEDRKKKLTCRAVVDWVQEDETTGEFKIGLSHLSLTDEEFRLLMRSFVEAPESARQQEQR